MTEQNNKETETKIYDRDSEYDQFLPVMIGRGLKRAFNAVVNTFNPNYKPKSDVAPDPRQQVRFTKTYKTDDIIIRNLTLVRPDEDENKLEDLPVLLRNLNLEIKRGTKLAIIGRNGSGKSTLLRGLVGNWPFGHGEIMIPAHASVLPLPQNPYIPDMPFRSAVTFPSPEEKFSDEEISEALRVVGHEDMIKYLPQKLNTYVDDYLVPFVQQLPGGYTSRIPDDQLDQFLGYLEERMGEELGDRISEWQISRLYNIFEDRLRAQRAESPPQDTVKYYRGQLEILAKTITNDISGQLNFPGNPSIVKALPIALRNIFRKATGRPVQTEAEAQREAKEVSRLTDLLDFYREREKSNRMNGSILQANKSGGEKQRLRFASVLLNKPDILIGDEPTSSLDKATGHALMKLITDTKPENTSIIFVMHDTSMLKYFDLVGEIKDGELIVQPFDPDRDYDQGHEPAANAAAPKP